MATRVYSGRGKPDVIKADIAKSSDIPDEYKPLVTAFVLGLMGDRDSRVHVTMQDDNGDFVGSVQVRRVKEAAKPAPATPVAAVLPSTTPAAKATAKPTAEQDAKIRAEGLKVDKTVPGVKK